MNVRRLALLLAPDLRSVARRLEEVERGLDVAQKWVNEAGASDHPHACMSEAHEAIVESRARLVEVVADITGRRPR